MRLGGQDVLLTPGSLAHHLYAGKGVIRERFRHRYEVDPAYVTRLEMGGLIFSGKHPTRPIMQFLELRRPAKGEEKSTGPVITHPYFVGSQFHPELTSRPLRPSPMFMGLLAAAIARKYGEQIDPQDPFAGELRRWGGVLNAPPPSITVREPGSPLAAR